MGVGKFIGCIMMVIGSAIGAGILLLPLDTVGSGFMLSTITILASWILLTITGLLILDLSMLLPKESCSFFSMAENSLGLFGKSITWLSCLLLLYSSLWAYMAGEASLIVTLFDSLFGVTIPAWVATGLFTVLLGAAVFWSTQAVDNLNRALFSFKGLFLIATITLLLPQVDITKLITGQNLAQSKYLWAASPILLCIFNYHFVLPSLRIYVGQKPKELKWIVILGTTLSLVIYLLWVIVTLGTIPATGPVSFTALTQLGHAAGSSDFAQLMVAVVNNQWIATSINCFFNVAMTTSFLGVSLGLFDFLADGFKRPNTRLGRLQTSILTFVPPFIFTMVWQDGFHLAMRWTGCFVAILCVALPAIMAYRLKPEHKAQLSYKIYGGPTTLLIIGSLGIGLSLLPILTNMGLLPTF